MSKAACLAVRVCHGVGPTCMWPRICLTRRLLSPGQGMQLRLEHLRCPQTACNVEDGSLLCQAMHMCPGTECQEAHLSTAQALCSTKTRVLESQPQPVAPRSQNRYGVGPELMLVPNDMQIFLF